MSKRDMATTQATPRDIRFQTLLLTARCILGVDAVDGAADGVGLHEGRVFEDP